MEQIYANADINGDFIADGFFGDVVMGQEDPLTGASVLDGDGEEVPVRLWLGFPDGVTGDVRSP